MVDWRAIGQFNNNSIYTTHIYIYIYVYIRIGRERDCERDREKEKNQSIVRCSSRPLSGQRLWEGTSPSGNSHTQTDAHGAE